MYCLNLKVVRLSFLVLLSLCFFGKGSFSQNIDSVSPFAFHVYLESCQCGVVAHNGHFKATDTVALVLFLGTNAPYDTFNVQPNVDWRALSNLSEFLQARQGKLFPGNGLLDAFKWLVNDPLLKEDFYLLLINAREGKRIRTQHFHNYAPKRNRFWFRRNWWFHFRLHRKLRKAKEEVKTWLTQQLAVHGYI